MSKKIETATGYEGTTILIRNVEASLLYYLGTEKNNGHKKRVSEYCALVSEEKQLQNAI